MVAGGFIESLDRGDVCVYKSFVCWSVLCTIRVYDLYSLPSNIVIVGRIEILPTRRLRGWVEGAPQYPKACRSGLDSLVAFSSAFSLGTKLRLHKRGSRCADSTTSKRSISRE